MGKAEVTAHAAGGRSWVYVWDPFVRLFHWIVVAAFATAYLTGDEVLGLHVWAGYVIGVLVSTRIVWGFVGPEHARFRDFLYSPRTAVGYFRDMLLFRSHRHLGHSPAGGVMVVALLVMLSVTVVTGLIHYGAEDHAGPLAPFFPSADHVGGAAGSAMLIAPAYAHEGEEHGKAGRSKSGLIANMHEIHETAANITLALVIVHFAAVVFVSLSTRENLVGAMVTGYKRPDSATGRDRRY